MTSPISSTSSFSKRALPPVAAVAALSMLITGCTLTPPNRAMDTNRYYAAVDPNDPVLQKARATDPHRPTPKPTASSWTDDLPFVAPLPYPGRKAKAAASTAAEAEAAGDAAAGTDEAVAARLAAAQAETAGGEAPGLARAITRPTATEAAVDAGAAVGGGVLATTTAGGEATAAGAEAGAAATAGAAEAGAGAAGGGESAAAVAGEGVLAAAAEVLVPAAIIGGIAYGVYKLLGGGKANAQPAQAAP